MKSEAIVTAEKDLENLEDIKRTCKAIIKIISSDEFNIETWANHMADFAKEWQAMMVRTGYSADSFYLDRGIHRLYSFMENIDFVPFSDVKFLKTFLISFKA